MTKWKGEVASYAANVAEVVCWISRRSLSLSLATGLAVGTAAAADRYWDANATLIGSGGTGTWNLTSGFWSPSGDGVSGPYTAWGNNLADNAIFGGTAGTVTLGSPISANRLTFTVGGYTLTGGVLTLGGTTPTITSTGTSTINSVIAGSSGLTKAGAGQLLLNGVNTFTGDISLLAGSLGVNGNAALGAAANRIVTTNGTTLTASGALDANRVVELGSGNTSIGGAGVGSARFTGTGGLTAVNGVTLSNDANDFTGQASFFVNGHAYFTSVGDVGEASSLGAGETIRFTAQNQYQDWLHYTGGGNSSNRDWEFATSGGTSGNVFINDGTGTLTLTGNIAAIGSVSTGMSFVAQSADMELLGEISSLGNRGMAFRGGGVGRTITLGNANTYSGTTSIGSGGAVTLRAGSLANIGTVSSFGTGTAGGIALYSGSVLSYTGAASSSNRNWTITSNGSIQNEGTGALGLSGNVTLAPGSANGLGLGGSFTGTNTLSGNISGTGKLVSSGAGTWVLSGDNSARTGAIEVLGGTLRAANPTAFGTVTGVTVNAGTLDLGGHDLLTPTLSGTGGTIALGAGNLSVNTTASTRFAGAITGTGGLTKTGAGGLTLSGQSTYSGDTTLGGGTLTLDFSAPGAPASNIISAGSTLNMAGGTLAIQGGTGANGQTFDGLNIGAGSNRIATTSGAGGSVTVDLGLINRTGGIVDFASTGTVTYTTDSGSLGGWATINGTDYAKVDGGVIKAFDASDYTDKDDAGTWLTGDVISDAGGAANSPFFGTVSADQQLGGLKYTAAAASTVTIGAAATLGIDGTIIVGDTVGNNNQSIVGGSLTGGSGGGTLGVYQNGGGSFTIASAIVDNSGATRFTKSGTGAVRLSGANTYTGATTLSGGRLEITSLANAGSASSIGAASADASNLVLESGTLAYVGATDTATNRGFTLVDGGAVAPTIEVNGSRTIEFSGQVTSLDSAGLIKTGLGTLVLSNAANDYVGVTTVTGGSGPNASTLSVNTLANGGFASGIGAASSDSANLVLSAGGRLQYTGGTVVVDRGFTLDGAGGRIDVAAAGTTLTISGTAVGAGGLTKEGDGTLVLSGTNTYTGSTFVDGGTLRAGSAKAFGPGGGFMTVNGSGTLDLGGYDITVAGLLGDGTVDLGNKTLTSHGGSANSFTGKITGTGGFTRSGSWTQVISGCQNDYTGKTTISGNLSVDCLADGGDASGIGASSAASANLVLNGGDLAYRGGDVTTDRGFTLQSGWGGINVVEATTTLEFSGQAVGGGSLEKKGAGTLVLSGANTYTGATSISGGTLRVNSSTALGSPAAMTLSNVAGALLDLNGFDTSLAYLSGGGSVGGNVALGGATLSLSTGGSGTGAFNGAINGTGSLVKSGTYIQELRGCGSTYTGSTTINSGVLAVSCLNDGGVASSIGLSSADASNLVINGGTLRYIGTGGSTNRQFTLGASGGNALDASGMGAINFTSNAPVTFAAANTAQTLTLTGTNVADNKLAARLTNNGSGVTSLTKTGTGTWILSNETSTYTGVTTISGGVLGVDKLADGGQASSLGASSAAASNLIIGNGSTLRYTGTGDTTNRLFTLSAGVTFIESSGTGAIVFTDTGPVTLAGNNQNRTIALGGGNTGNNTLAGSIGDAGTGKTTLAKNDGGTWVLTGSNTFTGNTVVNAGRLVLGNGGTTGSLSSNVVIDGGSLAFNRADTYGYGGLISRADAGSTGGIDQIGSGTTILTGANTYLGATNVNKGTLLINGNQSGATGLTTVRAGGTLGGTGTIGGDVAVLGGTIAPGSNGAGTLTINGSLTLDSSSTLAMQFGQAGTVGGALNDAINVNGNVTLDGTLDVSETAGGSFGPGVYRIISYTGTLTDNGLNVGTLPSGTGVIQTAVAGQVNLLAGGDDFSFWDGAAGPKNNGVVNGGNGIWQNGLGNDNWTESTGNVNAAYADGTFAIFAGSAGTVTVDNGLGQVTARGMQFATNGYVVDGDMISLLGTDATIRVGDGTAAGAGMTATIASVLAGTSKLVKTDAGTLVLVGANSYSGGTAINGGTLRIADDSSLGTGDISFNGGTLHTTANVGTVKKLTLAGAGTLLTDAGTILALLGDIDGGGALTKSGAGTLLLAGHAGHAGGTTIMDGTVQVGFGSTTGSIAGDIVNNATLIFDRSDALAYAGAISGTGDLYQNGAGTLTMSGNSSYTGRTLVDNGMLVLTGRIVGTSGLTLASTTAHAADMILDGANARLSTAATGTSYVGYQNNGTLTVRNGAQAGFAGLIAGSGIGSVATIKVDGPGSQVTQTGTAIFGLGGTATVDILGGGRMVSSGTNVLVGGQFPTGATGMVTVSGAGSRWEIANALNFRRGSVTIADGGVVTAGSSVIGFVGVGVANPTADLLVTGAGSRFETAGSLTITNAVTGGARGSITIADAGVVKAGNGTLAMGPGDAALNIGGVEGGPFARAGRLDAASVTMAAGTNRINFNHDTADYRFDAVISGAGALNHYGPGATVLTGNNSYTGSTTVIAGSLYINGDQSSATGPTTVGPAGTLGGAGTIGGDVVVVSASVNPGDLGSAPGTLTINGNLSLMFGSNLNFSFGQANVPGGPLNDLINVGGDLSLNGTLNVQASAGGSFDPGIYRVINYAGSLSGTGLGLNAPTPDFYVQTSIPGQVNLVNTAGMALRYWDGDAGPKNDGTVNGGNGLWQAFGVAPDNGNDNWTEDGAINAPFADGAFAVFMGDAGTVTVDSGKGAVNVSGMQFITDGYVIDGDTINLVGAGDTVIRVGDGTTGGAGATATITAELAGGSGFVKSDMGTLVLAGSNSYAGGTTIRGGTLQIASDASLGAASGGITFDGGTLHTTTSFATTRNVVLTGAGSFLTATNTTLTLDNPISGAGMLTKAGGGTLLLASDAAHTGGTTIAAGTLQLGDGGTGGSVTGNIVNNGLLAIDRSDKLTLKGKIFGSGAFTQNGGGTTILTGANGYTGGTTVNAGALLVNGDQSLATGVTNVASGATLGGAGIIGGNVVVAGGATLQPGSSLDAASTLTVKGDLSLGSGSKLAMQFGEANVEGGGFNDLIHVGGNLTLGGTLDVSVSPGGIFGGGIYRVINYGGTLTNNGLALGAMPAGSDVFLQTSVAGQINLVNGAGLALNYWDGDAGPKFDGQVAGGDGIWQGTAGNDNWTDAAGDINAPYANGSYAIFTGAAGTVTVDNSLGQVEATGMQFAVDGYRIEGDELKLTGSQSVIRVGDGTSLGISMTTTIAAVLSGSGELVKADLGTLVLTGNNSYTGGTSMTGGTLQVAADTALGDKAGGLSFNGGTLHTTAVMTSNRSLVFAGDGTVLTDDGTSLTLNGVLSGNGDFTKSGSGTLALTADSSAYGGLTTVDDGTLVVSGVLGGKMAVAVGGRLEGAGKVGATSNSGTIAVGHDGVGTLTIQGNYTGHDGRVEISAVLGDDSSDTGRLVIAGATAGTTQIGVTNRGGLGAQTVEGIKIIDVGGASSGTFTLDGDYEFQGEQAVVGGAYGYRLYKGGVSSPNDGDWYLRSALLDPQQPEAPLYQPGVALYESYAAAMQELNQTGTLQQRIGNRVWGTRADAKGDRIADSNGIWARIEAAHAKFDPEVSTSGANYDANTWKFQTGIDGLLAQNEAGRFIGGLYVQYGTASSSVWSPYGTGSIDTTGYSLGATLTWYGESGFYVDALAQITWYDSDLRSATAGRKLVDGNGGMGYGLSIEAGQRIELGGGWSLTPQAQLSYSDVRFDSFHDVFDAEVSLRKGHDVTGRLGIAVNHEAEWRDTQGRRVASHLYGIANLYYGFAGATEVDVAGVAFSSRNDRLRGGIGLGGTLNWADDKYSLYGEARLDGSLKDAHNTNSIGGTVGFRMRW
ncbi:autotransporter-associated beta strand repeat-containing protein [Pseudaminobacter salicylatoxidans]|nr:autotransporter-associated beta strand repeat-containing protein [Pseudaminobacter salicylatoxidans]